MKRARKLELCIQAPWKSLVGSANTFTALTLIFGQPSQLLQAQLARPTSPQHLQSTLEYVTDPRVLPMLPSSLQAQHRAGETYESAKNTVSENVGAAQNRAGEGHIIVLKIASRTEPHVHACIHALPQSTQIHQPPAQSTQMHQPPAK